MKEEKQRIAIAEACGWKWWNPQYGFPFEWESPDGFKGYAYPPDYLNDLNAMHEAEKVLFGLNWGIFTDHLSHICPGGSSAYHATAAQRAEAFLITLGKWEEA